MKARYFIYGLLDIRSQCSGELRYVGQSAVGMRRPKEFHSAKCLSWQKHLRSIGLREEIWIIEEWDGNGDWKTWLNDTEIFWIGYYRMIGCDLTNIEKGGEGRAPGFKQSDEVKQSISNSLIGHPGYWKGKTQTPEMIEARSIKNRGKKHSNEFKEKRRQYALNMPQKHRENISASQKKRWSSREVNIICLNDGKKYKSRIEAASAYGISTSSLDAVIHGKRDACKGFRFKKDG